MFVCNVLLKCPKNLVKDILKDGHEEINELLGDVDIHKLLALPEDIPTVNIDMSKRLNRLKITQIRMYTFICILFFFLNYYTVCFIFCF